MRLNLRALALLTASVLMAGAINAQLSVTATSTDFTIDFDNTVADVNNGQFAGAGLATSPAAGQLDADGWNISGFSTGSDLTRGQSNGGVTTGGLYAFEVASGNYTLGVQPGGSDWTPGSALLIVTNNTGTTVSSVELDYLIWEYNDQGRSNSLNFAWSTDGTTFTDEASLDFATAVAAAGSPAWTSFSRNITLNGLSLANGASIFLRWTGDDVSGSGSRDEYALDDIVVNMTGAGGPATTLDFATPASATVLETAGTTDLTLEISNPDATTATDIDVVLISGDAARINSYTTQTVSWAAGDATDKTLTITITDDALVNGDEVLTFELQNPVGGSSAAAGSVDQFVLTVQDDEVPTAVQFQTISTTVTETGVSFDLTLEIANESAATATTCDVVLLSGDATRIGGYTTTSVTFPPASSANETVTVTITDDALCNGKVDYVFEIQNVAGGASAAVGANSSFSSRLNDDEGLNVGGEDDFEDASIADWTEGVVGHWTASTTTPINGTHSLKHNLSGVSGNSYISLPMNNDLNRGDNVWRLQVENGNWDPSTGNRFWFWLSANDPVLNSTSIDGYVVGVNYNGSDDLLALWRIDNNGGSKIITSSINWDANNIAGIEVTRDFKGNWELLVDTDGDFDALVSEGTVNDDTYSLNNAIGPEFFYSSTRAGLLWFDDISYEQTGCFATYYSQGSGDINGSIWSTTPVGPGALAEVSPTSSFIVQSGHVVTQTDALISVDALTVQTGGEYNAALPGFELSVYSGFTMDGLLTGDPLTIDATAHFSSFTLGGTEAQLLLSPIWSINVANSNATMTTGGWTIVDELTVDGGATLDMGGNSLILDSDASGTARIGNLSDGTLLNATNVTMRRFIPAGATNWRALGSPMTTSSYADVNDDFFTAGFPGSDYPIFYTNNDPTQPLWPSIRNYDETNTGALTLDGLEGPANITDAIAVGEGFVAWAGDTIISTSDLVIDFTGTPNTGFINLPTSYTSTGDPLVDGWNLVANPMPSPIDFGSVIKGADIENNYYVYDPVSGNNATWNESLGLSVPAGALNGNIQSSQSFWVHAVGAANTVTVNEGSKVHEPLAGGLFGGMQNSVLDMLRLKVSSGINAYYDEAALVFENGSDQFESSDIDKFIFNNGVSPQIALETSDGQTTSINDWGAYTTALSVPVQVDVPITGTYTLTLFDAESVLGMSCVSIEDMVTGQITPMIEGATYDFTINANDPASPARFVLHLSSPAVLASTDASCYGMTDGTASLQNNTSDIWTIDWLDDANNLIQTQTVANGTTTLTGLSAGDYSAVITGGCGVLVNEFSITQPGAMGASSTVEDATCAGMSDAMIDITPQGGAAPLSYAWSNGSTDEDLLNVPSGQYDLTITDANGCTFTQATIVVGEGSGPAITAAASASNVLVGDIVNFTGTAPAGSSVDWDMGDGNFYTVATPAHSYSLPGTYTASFTADLAGCSNTGTVDITVSTSTGVDELADGDFHAYAVSGNISLTWNQSGFSAQVLDVTGKLIHDAVSMPGSTGTKMVNMNDQPAGIYFILLQSEERTESLRVQLLK